MLAPKEQPPRKLSGKRTVADQHLESSGLRGPLADGITFSGTSDRWGKFLFGKVPHAVPAARHHF